MNTESSPLNCRNPGVILQAVVEWLKVNRTEFASTLNIVYADAVNRHAFVDAVLAFNFA